MDSGRWAISANIFRWMVESKVGFIQHFFLTSYIAVQLLLLCNSNFSKLLLTRIHHIYSYTECTHEHWFIRLLGVLLMSKNTPRKQERETTLIFVEAKWVLRYIFFFKPDSLALSYIYFYCFFHFFVVAPSTSFFTAARFSLCTFKSKWSRKETGIENHFNFFALSLFLSLCFLCMQTNKQPKMFDLILVWIFRRLKKRTAL